MKRLPALALLLVLTACSAPAQQVQIREVQVVVTATPDLMDAEAYATWAMGWTTYFVAANTDASTASEMYDFDGMKRAAREIIALCREPARQSPPSTFAEAHRYLLMACEEYTTGNELVIRGIDNLDLDVLEAAISHIDNGNTYLDMSTNAIP